MPPNPESRRLQTVIKDQAKEPHGKSNRAFARFVGISEGYLRRMLKGDYEMNYTVINAICVRLGYSPTWLLFGTGDKKMKGGEAKLVTEMQMLRTELDITAKLALLQKARMTGVEKEYEELKHDHGELKKRVSTLEKLINH
jgi:hypothetical protein